MSPIERAKADLARIEADVERVRAQMASLGVRREKVRAYIEMAEFYESNDAEFESARAKGGVSGAAVRASVEAIRERGKAIHTRELLEILGKQNIQIGGKEPVANLSGFLSRSDELRNSRAHGWGLAEWGSPPDDSMVAGQEELHSSGPPSRGPIAPAGYELDDEVPF